MSRKLLCSILYVLFLISVSQNAYATCDFRVESFSIANIHYDPLSPSDTTGTLTYSIRNTGSVTCTFKAYFCAHSNTQKNGSASIVYNITTPGSSITLLNQTVPDCPSSTAGLNLAKQHTLSSGELYTSSTDFEIAIPNSQFSAQGYYMRDVDLAVFTSYGEKKDSRRVLSSTIVEKACEMSSQPVSHSSNNAIYTPTGSVSGGTVNFSGAIDKQRATLRDSFVQLKYGNSRCNYNAHVSVKSANGGMIQTSGSSVASEGFLNKIDYIASVVFCGTQTQVATNADGAMLQSTQCTNNGINQSSLVITISTIAGNIPLLAGQYEDILTVRIGAGL